MIGKRIRELRRKKGMSMSGLAAKAGVSKSYLSNIENDLKNNPSIEVLTRISSVLDVDINQIIGTEMEEPINEEWLDFIKAAEDAGIDKVILKDYKEVLEFISWRSEKLKK